MIRNAFDECFHLQSCSVTTLQSVSQSVYFRCLLGHGFSIIEKMACWGGLSPLVKSTRCLQLREHWNTVLL